MEPLPDFQCTFWLDGWLKWAGIDLPGDWQPCCVDHDFGGTLLELFQCVSASNGGPLMATLMVIGLALFGIPFIFIRNKLRRTGRRAPPTQHTTVSKSGDSNAKTEKD